MKNGKIIINLNIKKYQESDYAFLGTFLNHSLRFLTT